MSEYQVFVKADDCGRIMAVNSSAFIADTTGWVQIDEGTGDRYHHAQGNYFPKPKYDERGIPRYAYVKDGDPKWRERTKEEMDADYTPPEKEVTAEELLEALMEGVENAKRRSNAGYWWTTCQAGKITGH